MEQRAGQLIDKPNFEDMEHAVIDGFSVQKSIPISHNDVHQFIVETREENLFLINQNNKEQEQKEKMSSTNDQEIEKMQKQIKQTMDTIKVLVERKEFI